MRQEEKVDNVPIWKKYALTVAEASLYFHIGEKKLRRLIEEDVHGDFSFKNGKNLLIKREQFEKILNSISEI